MTKSGAKVAVKVQYPGIDKAIENDLKSISMLEMMMGPLSRKLNAKATLDEIRRVFLDELDYGREAEMSDVFRRINADDPDILIPEVHHASARPPCVTTVARPRSLRRRSCMPLKDPPEVDGAQRSSREIDHRGFG